MVAPIGINTNTYSQANATRNMQQVGGQSQVTRKNDIAPQSEAHNTAAADNVQLSEGVSFAQDAQENATHIGAAQNQFEQEIGDTFESAEEPEVGAAQSGAAGTTEEAAPKEPQTDEYGFILMDDQGNTIGGSVPTDDDGAGTPPPVDGGNGGAAGEVPPEDGGAGETESATARAERLQKMEQDREAALSILTQMQADRQKWLADLMKILSDTQASIFDIIQQAANNRAMAFDRAMMGWSRVFNGH